MFKHTLIGASVVATAFLVSAGLATGDGTGQAETGGADYTAMTREALAEHLIFEAGGFKLDQPVQEGGTARQRLVQDEIQRLCTEVRNDRGNAETMAKVSVLARESIRYPEDGIKLGDWKIGRELAWSGFGYRVGHRNDDHSKAKTGPGGNCYNCHQMATDRTGGSIGPSLTGYGKLRGSSEPILKYTYDVIYNPHAYFACTHMPRIGAKGLLTDEQISHVMAYLLDPESPVNQ
ncbi:MAG: sulfur oxidation c-type cytochrome SoxX [Chromatiaceae bacterium]|jgi:sulfur-oxidizing protein SoxX